MPSCKRDIKKQVQLSGLANINCRWLSDCCRCLFLFKTSCMWCKSGKFKDIRELSASDLSTAVVPNHILFDVHKHPNQMSSSTPSCSQHVQFIFDVINSMNTISIQCTFFYRRKVEMFMFFSSFFSVGLALPPLKLYLSMNSFHTQNWSMWCSVQSAYHCWYIIGYCDTQDQP